MNARFIYQSLLAPVLLLAAISPSHAQMYSYTDLGAGVANAINDAGQVAGDNLSGDAILWNGTTPTVLKQLGYWDVATGVNDAGQVAGYFDDSCMQQTKAGLWMGSNASSLTPSSGQLSSANGINSSGVVVGDVFSSAAPANKIATIWNGSSAISLGIIGSTNSSIGTAINNHAQEAGYFYTTSQPGQRQAVLWNGTTPTVLGTLGSNTSSEALGINNHAQEVGYADVNNVDKAVLWNGTTATALSSLGGSKSQAEGINDAGAIVGYSDTAGNSKQQAVLWKNGKIINLNSYLTAAEIGQGWVLENATAINNDGSVVGDAVNTLTGQKDAFLLQTISCVPEPQTCAMLLVGLSMIVFTRRRKTARRSI